MEELRLYKIDNMCESKNYERLSGIKKAKEKMTFRCDKGHVFHMSYTGILKGNKCNICTGKCPKHMKEKFESLVEETDFHILETYTKAQKKVLLKCPVGHEFYIFPSDFRNSRKCTVCSGKNKAYAEKTFLQNLKNSSWKPLEPYVNSKRLQRVVCDKGHEIEIRPNDLYYGVGCGVCTINDSDKMCFYICLWYNLKGEKFLKFGISVKPKSRFSQQKGKQTNGVHNFKNKTLLIYNYENALEAKELERIFKNSFKFEVEKAKFPDGYSETTAFSTENLDKMKEILRDFKDPDHIVTKHTILEYV